MKFEPSFFIKNRKVLLSRSKAKLIVIPAHTAMQRNADAGFLFRQDSNFWYLAGINEPDYTLVISKEETYLIAPKLTNYQLVMESQTSRESLKSTSGIQHVLSAKDGWAKLQKQLTQQTKMGVISPPDTRYYALSPNPARSQLLKRLRRYAPAKNLIDIRNELTSMRVIKQSPEVEAIQEAIDITIQTTKEVFAGDWADKFKYEYEVEAAISYGFRKRGASGHAFAPIVISGSKTASIHNYSSNDQLKQGQLIQIDIGAEVSNYAADISRVFPIGNKLSQRQMEIIVAVKDVQKFALTLIKPGALVRDNEKLIEEYMGKTLKKLGLISAQTKEAIRARYPHSCSHMLGLDVHDAADYSLPLSENRKHGYYS